MAIKLDQLSTDGEISQDVIGEYLHANRPKNQGAPDGERRGQRQQRQRQRQQGQGQPQRGGPSDMNREFLEQQFQAWDGDDDGSVSHSDLPKPPRRQSPKSR